MMNIELKILDKKFYNEERNGSLLNPLPEYATEGSAAIDLKSTVEIILDPNKRVFIPSGLAVWIKDPNVVGMIVPRSSTGTKGLVLANTVGVIDSDYQGEIILSVWNSGEQEQVITEGQRIAQMLFLPIIKVKLDVVQFFSNTTGRGGFGSTGV